MIADKPMQVLIFIRKFRKENDGISPTIREIQQGINASSTSLIDYYLESLEMKGLIKRKRGISRGIIPVSQDQLKIGV